MEAAKSRNENVTEGNEPSGAPVGHSPLGENEVSESTETSNATAPREQCDD